MNSSSDQRDATEATEFPAEAGATPELVALLYEQLHGMAARQLRREAPGHTLSATALVHEAWLRLEDQSRQQWNTRAHFLAMAATMMRRVLVNHALAKQADKRAAQLVTLSEAESVSSATGAPELLRVHEALRAFEAVDARAAKVVELRFFGGLELDEIAQLLQTSLSTVKRDWALARAWLHRELSAV